MNLDSLDNESTHTGSKNKPLQLPDTFKSLLKSPILFQGVVIHGFGRGSRELGIPTANIDPVPFSDILSKIENGVYFGFARVCNIVGKGDSKVFPMSMSIGYNPHFKNTEKSIEPYIIHEFPEDFYGAYLKILCLGYLRPELSFSSLEELKSAIANDVTQSLQVLSGEEYQQMKEKLSLEIPETETKVMLAKSNS